MPDGMPVVGKGVTSQLVLHHQGSLPDALTAIILTPETKTVIFVLRGFEDALLRASIVNPPPRFTTLEQKNARAIRSARYYVYRAVVSTCVCRSKTNAEQEKKQERERR
jgi:hypothetical protein